MACAIELDATGPYAPGKRVTGKLLCLFNTYESIQEIKCYLKGEERVSFVAGDTYREYRACETFLKSEIEIMQACRMQPGTYKYPFSFDLPAGIPSSFEHAKGRVVYEITAEVSRGAGRFYRNSHMIHVSVTVNLNDMMHEISLAPVTYPMEEVVDSYCCCYNAHVFLALSLEKGAFLVGEDIKISLDVNNVASIDIIDVVLKLESHTEVTVEQPERRKMITVDDIFSKGEGGVLGNTRKVYDLCLKVPGYVKVYSFRKCKLIRQWYSITAVIIFGDCYDNVRLTGKITLAHVSVDGPRPIGLPQPSGEPIGPSISRNYRNVIPVAQAPVDIYPPPNRPPYPLDDSHFPSPHHSHVMPPMPTVHLPASYSALPSAPPPIPSPRRNPRNSAPLAEEDDALLPQNGTEEPTPPPTYDEAIFNDSNATRRK